MSKSPRLDNIEEREELLSLSRKRAQLKLGQSVKYSKVEEFEEKGWVVQKENKHTVRMTKTKPRPGLLEDRVWTLLYRMGFDYLSGKGGSKLVFDSSDEKSPTQQIDVVAIDSEVAIAVECKTKEVLKKDPQFAEKLTKHAGIKGKFANAVHQLYPLKPRRKVATVMVTWDVQLKGVDWERAKQEGVVLLDLHALEYYEALVKHIGIAARYQLLSELFRGKKIEGLKIKVPALKTKMGKRVCYTFSCRPEHLLKISYIAHRAKGKALDVDAYQRQVSKYRLKKIGKFISEKGIFPTNVVINVENARHTQFDRAKQSGGKGDSGGTFGWLTLSANYGSAAIIDGQHRLFAYSGHPEAEKSYLNVLAFQSLNPAAQTKMFVDINSEQKSVPRSLLVELDATMKWDHHDPDVRIHAIVSRASMALDEDQDGPLYRRVLLANMKKTSKRCLSLTSLVAALKKPGFFIADKKKKEVLYGPFWNSDSTECLERTTGILTAWLGTIASEASDWWDLGAEEGGGLAMNYGLQICINTLRNVLRHLDVRNNFLFQDTHEVAEQLQPYAKALGIYFHNMPPDERREFRNLHGNEGQSTGLKICQMALNKEFPDYHPHDLDEWVAKQDRNNIEQARRITADIETKLQKAVIDILRKKFPEGETWWFEGVPKETRKRASAVCEEEGYTQKEDGLYLIDNERIIHGNWTECKDVFGRSEEGAKQFGKDKGTAWLRFVNRMRNAVSHTPGRASVAPDELVKLEDIQEWLDGQLRSIT